VVGVAGYSWFQGEGESMEIGDLLKSKQQVVYLPDLATIFGKPQEAIKKKFQRGSLPGIKVGKRWAMNRLVLIDILSKGY
jgi:hypothetical protein